MTKGALKQPSNSLKITIDVYCFIPPIWMGNLMTPQSNSDLFFLSASESQRRRLHPQRHRHRGGGSPWPARLTTTSSFLRKHHGFFTTRTWGPKKTHELWGKIYILLADLNGDHGNQEVFWGGHKNNETNINNLVVLPSLKLTANSSHLKMDAWNTSSFPLWGV